MSQADYAILDSIMKNFDSRTYSISDFVEWRDSELLNLSPDFQRRAVWKEKARSYLIDTVLRKKPIPKMILSQELKGKRSVRVVVDGQQRLRAILGFYDGDFKISRAHNEEHAGLTYEGLPPAAKSDFLKYELAVDVLFDPEYPDLLDIFARINTYTVTLKQQERLNAKYVGFFKQSAFRLGFKYVEYWLQSRVFGKPAVTRMAEAAMAGDLLMALIGGVQTNKNIESFYKRFEETDPGISDIEKRFDAVMSVIGTLYPPAELASTNWSRPVLFYTLFTTVAHLTFGLEGPDKKLKRALKKSDFGRIRARLDEVSEEWSEVGANLDDAAFPAELREFVRLSRRATTDTKSRIGRVNFLGRQLVGALEK